MLQMHRIREGQDAGGFDAVMDASGVLNSRSPFILVLFWIY